MLLGHAPQEADHEARLAALARREGSDVRENAVLGVSADRAGDEKKHVGGAGVGHNAGARGAQDLGHQLGIELVHLATVGRDVDARGLHGSGRL